ncbi:hypothetical protein EIN_481190 [Entamoeba invadens IP1]|uniref:small monomeric GTPase n=1 Tax=Entamoeba invadens IP1 TaxID=370355 RepID=L7FQW1_ENTIV|nr:hypothetical protein EIN_481190 [Entamoeba invadens IP1]ELP95349.1 hypothetical protein EIN_481190 [Entamoeba invadens IP1]|eukprot:XP_004262120.1 hypothetical protein EIN_481190 [Entamoeba invadens IP1]
MQFLTLFIFFVFIGDEMCGKTQLINCLCDKPYYEEYEPTLEDSYMVTLYGEATIQTALLDTSGRSEYASLVDSTIRIADCILLCFSLYTDKSTCFTKTRIEHIRQLYKIAPVVLIGTMFDLREDKIKNMTLYYDDNSYKNNYIKTIYGITFANEIGALSYIECSAKEKFNIELIKNKINEFAQEKILRDNKKTLKYSKNKLIYS